MAAMSLALEAGARGTLRGRQEPRREEEGHRSARERSDRIEEECHWE